MPSALPRFVVRAPQERIDAWKGAAQGSANEWAVRVLDQAAGIEEEESPKPSRARSLAEACPRARHHRLGVFCKECGAAGS